jgi:hypothetical protein
VVTGFKPSNVCDIKNVRHVTSRHFRNKKKEYLKAEINEHGTNLRERYHLGDPGVDGRIASRCIFRKWEWTELNWLRTGTAGGHLERR